MSNVLSMISVLSFRDISAFILLIFGDSFHWHVSC